MYNFFVLAVVVLCLRRGVGQTIHRRAALFNTLENFRVINGDLIKRQRSQSLGTCTQQCLSEPSCASFNFGSSSDSRGFCELYKDGGDVTLSAKPGWLCGKLLDKRQFVKPPAECKTWRTKDGGCCVFPFFYQGKLHDTCIFDGQLWCSVTDNYDTDRMRGACQDFNFTFTTLGAQGETGPSNTSGYQGTTLENKVTLQKGIQIWKVPLNGTYVIEAWGASGAVGRQNNSCSSTRAGGKGAYMKGCFNLTQGTSVKILIGQRGSNGKIGFPLPGGGGGGTFVVLNSGNPLIIAGGGGGGGAPTSSYHVGDPGQITENGSQSGGVNGDGGILLVEGSPSASFAAGAGGGLIGNGESGEITNGGSSFNNGGQGGKSPSTEGNGGFGGGGGGSRYPGGGGGYSGGGVMKKSGVTIAGGGGSLNRGINQEKTEDVNRDDGKVVIVLVEPEK